MNYMEQVAKILGVELGEKFELKSSNDSCYTLAMFTDDGLKIVETNVSDQCFWKPYALEHLLKGNYTIKRIPWKPSYNDRYYSVTTGGMIEPGTWLGDFIDITLYKLGNCYCTAEEAESNCQKWIDFFEADEIELEFEEV